MRRLLKGTSGLSILLNRCVHGWELREGSDTGTVVLDIDSFVVTLLCLQVCAIISLLPAGALADLTCEALLMLSGNVSSKSRTNIG